MQVHRCMLDDLEKKIVEIEDSGETIKSVVPDGRAAIILTEGPSDRGNDKGVETR